MRTDISRREPGVEAARGAAEGVGVTEIVTRESGLGSGGRWPTELRVSKDRRTLTVTFDDGGSHALSAEYLRVCSPSAEVQGHSPAERKIVPGKRDVAIHSLEPVGNYAVRIVFDDRHSTGIFGWDLLDALGREREERWGGYLADLSARGLSREPRFGA